MAISSESLFAEHLAHHDEADSADNRAAEEAAFEALLKEHPERGEELERLRASHRRVGAAMPRTISEGSPALHRPSAGTEHAPKSAFHAKEGATIGDFRLLRLLGRGGMGEVWEAEQSSLSRHVALKLMLPERVDERGLDFFAREARAGGRLAHPGIVSVFGAGVDDGAHWIAMELVEGECDLRNSMEGLREEAELSEGHYEHVAEFTAQLADALEAAHSAGVIHRDLKPGNILVTGDDQPKVLDFGLAKLTDEFSISHAGELLGTYYYMSPEQVATKRAGIDHRTDIFSLGVVLYEMLTLVRPFDGDTTEQVAHKILWVDATDPRAVRSRIPRDLAVICGKAMEKDSDRRYQTMAELAADLRRHLSHEPVLAKPPTVAERMVKWTRRNPVKAASGAIAAASFMVVSVLLADNIEKRTALADALQVAEGARAEADQSAEEAKVEAKTTQEVLRFMVGLFEISDPSESRGETITAREVLDQGAEKISRELGEQPLIRSRLQGMIGNIYMSLGLYEAAEPLYLEALEEETRSRGRDHVETLVALNNVAGLYLAQGRWREAGDLYLDALDRSRRVLGELHPNTLGSTQNLAALLIEQGRFDEAEEYCMEALEGQRQVLGLDHIDTLGAQNNLAMLYMNQGRLHEAEPLLLETLADNLRVLGRDHPSTRHTINVFNEWAWLFVEPGVVSEEAERELGLRLIRRAAEVEPEEAAILDTLAWALFANGFHDEALATSKKALELADEDQKHEYQGYLDKLKEMISKA